MGGAAEFEKFFRAYVQVLEALFGLLFRYLCYCLGILAGIERRWRLWGGLLLRPCLWRELASDCQGEKGACQLPRRPSSLSRRTQGAFYLPARRPAPRPTHPPTHLRTRTPTHLRTLFPCFCQEFKGKTLTSEDFKAFFTAYFAESAPGVAGIDWEAWLHAPGGHGKRAFLAAARRSSQLPCPALPCAALPCAAQCTLPAGSRPPPAGRLLCGASAAAAGRPQRWQHGRQADLHRLQALCSRIARARLHPCILPGCARPEA